MNRKELKTNQQESNETQSGFIVPDCYFSDLESHILKRTSQNRFIVPDQYFEQLEGRINKRLHPSPLRIIHRIQFRKALVGIAASIIFVSGIIYFTLSIRSDLNNSNQLSSLSDEEIINYMDISDLKDVHVIDVVKSTENKQFQMEEYLLNNAEEQQIIEEL